MEKPTTNPMRLDPAQTLVVYDMESGRIVQVHHFAAMQGAELPPQARLHEMALQHAATKHRRDVGAMKVLEIDSRAMKPKASYRVSTSDRTLVEIPAAGAR